jgi:hypothetical protein
MSPQLLTEREAATALRVSRNRVKGLLPRIKLGPQSYRYDAADVAALIERLKTPPPSDRRLRALAA